MTATVTSIATVAATATTALPLCEQGFECSDMDSFFSSTTGGFRSRVEPDGEARIVTLRHGRFRLTTDARPGALVFRIEALQPTWVYDLVARWVVPADFAASGVIGGELVPRGSELYHEHPVTTLTLGTTRIRFVGSETLPPSLRPALYLRSEGPRWIVHARAIAALGARPFEKHTDGTSVPFSGGLVEERVLNRRREFAAAIYPTQVQPHVLLAAGTRVTVGLTL